MDYEILGTYSNMKKAVFGNSFLHQNKDLIYEIREFPIDSLDFIIRNSSLIFGTLNIPLRKNPKKIIALPTHIFICYDKTLMIYDNKGNVMKEFTSSDSIFVGSSGFLINDRVHFIVNLKANVIFVRESNKILNFNEDGTIFSVQCNDENENLSWTEENKSKGFLTGRTLRTNKVYDADGDIILKYGNYTVFRDKALIENIVCCTSIKLEVLKFESKTLKSSESFITENKVSSETSDCIIVLCKNFLFIIFKNLVIRKDINFAYLKIIPQKLIIHNYVNEESFYDCFLLFNCFKPISLFKNSGIEAFLSNLINFNLKLSIEFIKGLKMNSLKFKNFDFQLLMCKIYRLIDDSAKHIIDPWIEINSLTADQMFYIIIYFPNLLEKFIHLCKLEGKLFYLEDLKDFYIKTENIETYQKELLKQGLLIFNYKGLEYFNEIEAEQIRSQKSEYLKNLKLIGQTNF